MRLSNEARRLAVRPPALEPVMGGAVGLDHLAQAGPSGTALVDARQPAGPGFPEAVGDHTLAKVSTEIVWPWRSASFSQAKVGPKSA